jgi:hypothetical protein
MDAAAQVVPVTAAQVTGQGSQRPALAAAPQPTVDGLSDRDREILLFERRWWRYAGNKEQAIRELFDLSATRYYQALNALLDSPVAMAADPMLVKRLRRMRSSRQRARAAKRLGVDAKASPFPGVK